MTILIADNSPRISYTATSGQTAFTVPFEFFDNTDLNVYINDTLQTLTTHYTVTGGSGSTGSITLVTGATAGDIVVITRDVTLERTTDFPTSGPFQVASLNTELDKVVAMIADMKDLADRGLRLSDSDTSATLVLANKDTRKGTVLAFNEVTGAVEVGPTIADTNTIAQIKADIATLADIQDGTVATNAITTVSSISSDVTTVSSNNANVTTVAGQTTNMQNITDNLTAVQNAATNATNAAASATAAASSATAAATSETNAGTSETNAATSATNASNSASAASTSASAASTSATAAASSATAAAASETAAGTSETNAATSATNAATSATNAGTSETNAASSATAAATSATNAATSATNAATSATAASSSATAAANSAAAAAAAFDNFDDTYLGSFTADPTVDNDGDALVEGALYFNTTANEMRVYDGANWIAASSAGTASLLEYKYTATAGQTTFSGTDDNSATLSYSTANLIVTLNGIVLENGTDYTATSGTSIVLTVGAAAGDELNVIAFKSFTTADMVSATTGGTFNGNVAVTGDLTVDTDTLYVDSTNNRVGIGTSSPSQVLEITNGTSPAYVVQTRGDLQTILGPTGSLVTSAGQVGTITNSPFRFTTNNTERMRIDNSGRVGIGTSAPFSDSLLTLGSAQGTSQSIVLNGFGSDGESAITNTNANLIFSTGYGITVAALTERMRIDSSGKVHIATGGSQAGATVSGTSIRSLDILKSTNTTSGFNQIVFYNPNGAVGTIRTTGSSTAYNTSSDYRLKENVIGITDGIERVKQLNPSRFNFIADADTTVDGFLAHEAATVVPEAVAGEKDAVDEDGNPEYQGIDQAKLVPLLTAALQEAITKIETLETQNADFETRLTALEAN